MTQLKDFECTAKGMYWEYYPISRQLGAKIYWRCNFTNKRHLKESQIWQDCQKEHDLMKRAEWTNLVPKVYGLSIIEHEDWKPVLFVEHIEGVALTKPSAYFTKKLKKCGIINCDPNPNNIIRTKCRKLYLVDFSTCFVEVKHQSEVNFRIV